MIKSILITAIITFGLAAGVQSASAREVGVSVDVKVRINQGPAPRRFCDPDGCWSAPTPVYRQVDKSHDHWEEHTVERY